MNINLTLASSLVLILVVSTLTGCPGDETQTPVNSRPTCEHFDEKIAQKLFSMGLGGIGMDYNSDGTRVESDDSRIGRCVANLNQFATHKDLNHISQHFTPCFENALNAKDEKTLLSKTKRCLADLKLNVSEVTFIVFTQYTFMPLLEKGRGSLNDVAGKFFSRSGWMN